MKVPLNETAIINLSVTGGGTAKIGPLSAREVFYPSNASVSANSNPTNESTCNIYVGDSNTQRFIDGCVDGSSGDSTDSVSGSAVKCGQYVWAVWSGGDPNVQARLTITGEKEI